MLNLKDPSLLKTQNFIDGKWISSETKETIKVDDPSNGKIIGEISVEGCSCEIEKMLKEIKDKVRQEGGEAIIDLSLGDGVGGRISTDMYLISGKVIVFIKNKVLQ